MDRRREVWARQESRLHVPLRRLPERPPTKRSCSIALAGSDFNIACSKLKQGSCLILLQNNDDAPKGGAFKAPTIQRIDTGCAITTDALFGRPISRLWAFLEGSNTPVLSREFYLEQLEARKRGHPCSGSNILNNRKQSEWNNT